MRSQLEHAPGDVDDADAGRPGALHRCDLVITSGVLQVAKGSSVDRQRSRQVAS